MTCFKPCYLFRDYEWKEQEKGSVKSMNCRARCGLMFHMHFEIHCISKPVLKHRLLLRLCCDSAALCDLQDCKFSDDRLLGLALTDFGEA